MTPGLDRFVVQWLDARDNRLETEVLIEKLPSDLVGLSDAMNAVTLSNLHYAVRLVSSFVVANTPVLPSNVQASVNLSWRVLLSDVSSGDLMSIYIPGADPGLAIPGSDDMDMTSQKALDLVSAIEGQCISESGNNVNVAQVELYGL